MDKTNKQVSSFTKVSKATKISKATQLTPMASPS
mgnify:FL=1